MELNKLWDGKDSGLQGLNFCYLDAFVHRRGSDILESRKQTKEKGWRPGEKIFSPF